MAVAVETSRKPDQSMRALSEFRTRLYQVLEVNPNNPDKSIQTLFPQELFEFPEDVLKKSIELAQQVSEAWQPQNSNHRYRPDDNVMVQGLLDFGISAVTTVSQSFPEIQVEDIEEGILQVITRIRGAVETSDGRKHNLRTDRDRLRNSFTTALAR